ncbi:beta-1,3-glucosyltransferase isoform 1-T2 [Glossina fuscipes fuscipes]
MNIIKNLFILMSMFASFAVGPSEVLFLIQSEEGKYYHQAGRNLREDLIKESFILPPEYRINVHMINTLFSNNNTNNNYNPGEWAILNVIHQLVMQQKYHQLINDNTRWIAFCAHNTHIKLNKLMTELSKENHKQIQYFGYTLHDPEPTIVHHFAFFENPDWFPYPMLQAGVIFSKALFERIANVLPYHYQHRHLCNSNSNQQHSTHSEFSIDAAHELARFIYDNVQIIEETAAKHAVTKVLKNDNLSLPVNAKQTSAAASSDTSKIIENVVKKRYLMKMRKIIMKKAAYICPKAKWNGSLDNNKCAMHAQPSYTMQCIPIKREEVYFAVKTCSKYYNDRLVVIQNTWAQYAKHIKYFSDVADVKVPTIDTGVPNADTGHCTKTLAILQLALKDIEQINRQKQQYWPANQPNIIRWLFLADDDTLLSVSGVCQILGCFNSSHQIYLGERYGYRLHALDGFNYITGGGGIAFSLPTLRLIINHCKCPSPSAPDDMILGSCLHSLQLRTVHSMRFHQARPHDYAPELLQLEAPISFHKFWQLDPLEVYQKWFLTADQNMLTEEIAFKLEKGATTLSLKSRRSLSETKTLTLNHMKVPVVAAATLHHNNKRHIDL